MSVPWFLDFLELPIATDAKGVRRAYATRLKGIDHEANPEGFATLRRAYESALQWVDRDPVVATRTTVASIDATTPDEPLVEREPPSHIAEAARLIDGFVAALPATADRELRDLLEQTTASLRQAYVDAPSVFEDRLIDLLAGGSVPRRAALFSAATEHFHWNGLDRLKELGKRGAWVDQVLIQRTMWDQQPSALRGLWTGLLLRAERLPLPPELVSQWPSVHTLLETYPTFLRLFLDPATINAWQVSFEQLPDIERQRAGSRSGAGGNKPVRRSVRNASGMPLYLSVALTMVAIQVGRFALNHAQVTRPPAYQPTARSEPAPPQARSFDIDCPGALRYLRGGSVPAAFDEATMRRSVLRVAGHCIRDNEWPDDIAVHAAIRRLESAPSASAKP